MKKFKTQSDYTEMWIENGIIHNVYKPNLVLDLTKARQMVEERLKISNGREHPLFIDINNLVSVDLEAREYLSGGDAVKLVKAGAIYCKNPIGKFAGKLFIEVNQPQVPTKVFTEKEEALAWLELYK